ncbi:uncharacterized protein [Engystomops pustulosus]|uniref:uncharacterized protein n=1 Tax=Engystomops pustulosus TaxID=76066 RepID=UPI003AFB4079
MKAQPPPHTRAWVNRCLEMTTASLKELHLMRQEAEERVRGVLEEQGSSDQGRWQRRNVEESMTCSRWRNLDMDQIRLRNLELDQIQEEVLVRLRRSKLENFQEITDPEESFNPDFAPDLVEGAQAKVHARKLGQWSGASPRPAKTILELTEENSTYHPPTSRRQNQVPSDVITSNQSTIWTRTDGHDLDQTTRNVEQREEQELLLSAFPTEPASLRRIGSGSLAPRLRLGSSGVTSDLLFTRRMSGNCLSAHSSGFYETSDLDSTSSSCSSLCSDISCHTSISLMSPHRSSGMRPRSIDCSLERKKELQSALGQTRRPMSAGALDGYFLRSASISRFDLTQSYDVAPCDSPCSGTPPLSAIQQRRKAERYIYKLALKFRCKPGGSTIPPDLGPQTPRRPAQSFSLCGSPASCPPSPHGTSLSTSMMDVRKNPTGSWGRFLSRVMLKKDSRTAASELHLEQCGKSSQDPLAEGQFTRAKSFCDLLSVNPFKRSQRTLNC